MPKNRKYRIRERSGRSLPRRVFVLLLVLLVLLVGGAVAARVTYNNDLQAASSDSTAQLITIKSGSSSKKIASQLVAAKLIRSGWAFELYVHSRELSNQLQAGTYAFSPNQDIPSIVKTLTRGAVQTNLVTILPGHRIDQVQADLINDGFSPDSVAKALEPAQYADVPVMNYVPSGTSTLEGLLYPDSFQKDATTSPSVIIRESLVEMGNHLTPDLQTAFAKEGLSVYQGIILSSIVEKEVSNQSDRAQAAQVFLKRMQTGMMLGSDVTAYYGAIVAGHKPTTTYDSAYNTLLHAGLPPTPISNVSLSSLQAVANPASTNWLYFVSGDDGNTYFSTNLQDHEALTQKYCHKLCQQ